MEAKIRCNIVWIIPFLALLAQMAEARVLNVCNDCNFRRISEAIIQANPQDTVLVRGGTYSEGNILVDKSLFLWGLDNPVIDGMDTCEIITVISDSVTIYGFTIQNVGTSYMEDRAGIRIRKSKHFRIEKNILRNTFFGIYLEHASDGIVHQNSIIGEAIDEMSSGNAIHLWYCKRIEVTDNQVSHHRDGIYFEFVDQSLIKRNTSKDNLRYGLHFMFSNDDNYFENRFEGNGAGVAVMFSRRINMWNNIFIKNWGKSSYGLLLKEIFDAEIKDNVFEENTIGIFVEGSNRITYTNNDFLRNGWAIKFSGGCLDNMISKNNFIGNTFAMSVQTLGATNSITHNFWDDYSGYDLDYDGVGDVAYRPVKLFNFVVNQTPESMVLLRSLFVDLLNFSEKVTPAFSPENVKDPQPQMKRIRR